MGLNSMGLGILISARDEATAVFDRVNRSFVGMDKNATALQAKMKRNSSQMQAGFAAAAMGVTGLTAAFASAQQAGKFEEAMSNLRVISGATSDEMTLFRQRLLGADHSMSGPVESAVALREMAAAGFTAGEAMEMLKPVLDLAGASLGELGISDSAALASQAIKAFGKQASDTTVLTEQMVKAANMFALAPRELPLAIGIVSRGAQTLNQSFDETLVTLGLVKNVIPTVERASTAAAVAMERLAGGRGIKHLAGLVDPIDSATGSFKPFLDIMTEITPKLMEMDLRTRKLKMIKIFGAEGLAGVNAIMTQLSTGVRDATGRIVKGAEAVKVLRQQITDSKGATANQAEARLATLPGQIQLLRSHFERLGIVVGEIFGPAIKPLVEAFGRLVTGVKNALLQVPQGVKTAFGKAFLLVSGLLTAVGGLLAAKALLAAFGVTIGGIAAAFAAVLVPLLAVGAAIGAVILVFKAFKTHAEQTGGGVLGFFTRLGQQIKLFFSGVMQLFTEGGFSGAVMKDLNKAENGGVKAFAIKVFLWVNRIKNFAAGVSEGFSIGIARLRPIFDTFLGVLQRFAGLFGITVDTARDNAAAFDAAGASGRNLGQTLAGLAGVLTEALSIGLRIATVAVAGFQVAWDLAGRTLSAIGGTIHGVLKLIIGILTADWKMAWEGAVKVVLGVVETIMTAMGGIVQTIAHVIDGMGKLVGKDFGLAKSVRAGVIAGTSMKDIERSLLGPETRAPLNFPNSPLVGPVPAPAIPSMANNFVQASPGVAASQTAQTSMADLFSQMRGFAPVPAAAAAGAQAINLTVKLDTDTVAKALHKRQKDRASLASTEGDDD